MFKNLVVKDFKLGLLIAKHAIHLRQAEAFYEDPITEFYGVASEFAPDFDTKERLIVCDILERAREVGEKKVERRACEALDRGDEYEALAWLWLRRNQKWPMVTAAGYTWRLRRPDGEGKIRVHKIEHQSYVLPLTAGMHRWYMIERRQKRVYDTAKIALKPEKDLGLLMSETALAIAGAIRRKELPYG